jgi:salicylate 5-hydroxylase small subunit
VIDVSGKVRARVPWGTFDAEEVRALYDDYAAALDAGDHAAWLDLFVDDASYVVVPLENVERGLPLATIRCESRGMLADRVDALVTTQFLARRITRHVITAVRPVGGGTGDRLETTASFLLLETIEGADTRVQCAGTYDDIVVVTAAGLRFAGKRAIYDAGLVPTSMAALL